VAIDVTRYQQVKIPVSDLRTSALWYTALLDLELAREFVEDGVLRGAVFINRSNDVVVALRDREVIPGQPEFAGFDLFALQVASRAGLDEVIAHCDRLGVKHTEIHERGPDGAALDVPDPDGTVVRFIWPGEANVPGFAGVESGSAGAVTFYDTPRLRL
jgi:catechol 2,3-dioxygenase-like lactoylglutathione lyase family enzyme